jgi:hypothetical protein
VAFSCRTLDAISQKEIASMSEQRTKLVYGDWGNGVIFIPESEALDLTVIHRAVRTASTWGELRRLLPDWAYEHILAWDMKEAVTFEEFLKKRRARNRCLSLSEAREEFEELDIGWGGRFPQDTDEFAPSYINGYAEGDWPEYPAKRMLDWVPQPIQKKYGEYVGTWLSGDQLHFEGHLEKRLVRAFRKFGFSCKKNEELVWWACGGDSA